MLKNDSITFLRLKDFCTEKGHHHCLKVFNAEKGLHHFLMALNVFQGSYSVERWWTATSEGRLFYHIYD